MKRTIIIIGLAVSVMLCPMTVSAKKSNGGLKFWDVCRSEVVSIEGDLVTIEYQGNLYAYYGDEVAVGDTVDAVIIDGIVVDIR